jgi:hypothetical protein
LLGWFYWVRFMLTYMLPVEVGGLDRTALYVPLVGAALVWRRWRRPTSAQPDMPAGISRGDLLALVVACVIGFLISFNISSEYWVWDREWHVPFSAALRGQKMPFENVYQPGRHFRYHLAGDLFATFIQSLSLAGMHTARALSVSHDLQSALLAGIAALAFRAVTPWAPVPCALAGVAPLFAGPIGLRSPHQAVLGAYQGYSDIGNMELSFRPHCMMSLLLLTGFAVTLLRLAQLARAGQAPRVTAVLALVPIVVLNALCDEMSVAIVCLVLGGLWLFVPQLLAPRRWQGLLGLVGLGLAILVAHRALAGTIGPGGPVSKMHLSAPRLPHFFSDPLRLTFAREPWKQLFVDVAPIFFPAAVIAFVLIRDRRQADGLHTVGQFAIAVTILALALFLCVDINGRVFEGHRFLTAARVLVPLVALMFAPRLTRGSLASFFLLAPIFAGIVVSFGYAYHRFPSTGHPEAAEEQYSVDCRKEFGARLGEKTTPTYVDEPIWYRYAGCRPLFAAPLGSPDDDVVVGWPQVGRGGFAKMNAQKIFPPKGPIDFVCEPDKTKWSEVCREGHRVGTCHPIGTKALACQVPQTRRAEIEWL